MFCSSLRRRRDWAPALSRFYNTGSLRWRETQLQGHDIAFPVEAKGAPQRAVVFKSILLATDEIDTPETKQRIERLQLLNGGRHVAIILLLKGEDAVEGFMHLQIQMHGCADIPVIPISSAMDLASRVEQLRQKIIESARQSQQRRRVYPIQHLLRQCVGGKDTQPLSQKQTGILTDITTGFRDLAAGAFDSRGQTKMCDWLGEDGPRVLAFLTDGPQPLTR